MALKINPTSNYGEFPLYRRNENNFLHYSVEFSINLASIISFTRCKTFTSFMKSKENVFPMQILENISRMIYPILREGRRGCAYRDMFYQVHIALGALSSFLLCMFFFSSSSSAPKSSPRPFVSKPVSP